MTILYPVNSCTCIFKAMVVWSIPFLIAFEIRIRRAPKKLVLYNIKTCFLHLFRPHYGKSPPPCGEGLYFRPNLLYTAYWSAVNFQPDHLYTTYRSVVNLLYTYILFIASPILHCFFLRNRIILIRFCYWFIWFRNWCTQVYLMLTTVCLHIFLSKFKVFIINLVHRFNIHYKRWMRSIISL